MYLHEIMAPSSNSESGEAIVRIGEEEIPIQIIDWLSGESHDNFMIM